MKIEDVELNRERLEKMGQEGDDFLKSLKEEDDFLENRKAFYSRLFWSGLFTGGSIFLLVIANIITLTREVGEPYITTQDGQIIKIKAYEVQKK